MAELAEHGPSKPHGEEGIDHIQQLNGGTFVEKADNYKEDPSGSRTGNGIGEQMTNVFNDVCRDADLPMDVLGFESLQRRATGDGLN